MRKVCIIALYLLIGLLNIASGQVNNPPTSSTAAQKWAWASEGWTGDDRPFRDVRNDIDTRIKQGESAEALLQKAKSQAKIFPTDPTAQFRWGYAAYKAALEVYQEGAWYEKMRGVSKALASTASPHAYEYSRLRFIIACEQLPTQQLLKIGERLVERDPKDYDVKYQVVSLIAWSGAPDAKERALSYANELVSAKPNMACYHSAAASVYFFGWMKDHNIEDGNKAVAEYKIALQLMRPDDGYRKRVELFIRTIQESQSRQKTDKK